MSNGNIHRGLVKSADLVANNARRRTLMGYPKADPARGSKGISESIRVSQVIYLQDTSKIQIFVSTEDSPAAVAFELGSGLRATEGPKRRYPIDPVEKDYLAFLWVGEPAAVAERAPHLPDGRVLLRHVDHPGIAPKPYLAPAVDEETDEILDILGDEVLISMSAEIGPDVIILK